MGNLQKGESYQKSGCFSCTYRELILSPTCANNYSNVFYRATIYCRKKEKVINLPHERCLDKAERAPIKPLGDYNHV